MVCSNLHVATAMRERRGTPNYKEPHEVDGVLFFAWGPTPSAWTSGNAFDFDVSTLIRPLEWGFYRASKEALQTEESEHVLIVAPGLVEGGVYGIIPQPEDKSPTKFVATKPPPQTLGGERADREIAPLACPSRPSIVRSQRCQRK